MNNQETHKQHTQNPANNHEPIPTLSLLIIITVTLWAIVQVLGLAFFWIFVTLVLSILCAKAWPERWRFKHIWLGALIVVTCVSAIALTFLIILSTYWMIGTPPPDWPTELELETLNVIATRSFAVVAGIGGAALIVISYRRQRATENSDKRDETRLFTDRFDCASKKLGDQEAAVRLAGAYALAHLADDAPEYRDDLVQMVIDVLCAYLRMPYTPPPGDAPKYATRARITAHHRRVLEFKSFREVRHTIISIIGSRLQDEKSRWRGRDYNFDGAIFDGGDLSESVFSGNYTSFANAEFRSGTINFRNVHFKSGEVDFDNAKFTGSEVSFFGARFNGSEVSFGSHFIDGEVNFNNAHFISGEVDFSEAQSDQPPMGLMDAIGESNNVIKGLPDSWLRNGEEYS